MNGALTLANTIATMDRPTLEHLVAQRIDETRSSTVIEGIEDPLTLSLELLRADSLTPALVLCDRESLTALLSFGHNDEHRPSPERARELRDLGFIGLVDDEPVALDEVTQALESLIAAEGVDLSETPAPGGSTATQAANENWFVAALTATQQAASLLRGLAAQPGKVNRRGNVAVATAKTLALQSHTEVGAVQRLLPVLAHAGLTHSVHHADGSGARLEIAPAAEHWFDLPHPERWLTLASAQLDALSPQLRRALEVCAGGGHRSVSEQLAALYPLLPDSFYTEAEVFTQLADELGLAPDGNLTEVVCALLESDEVTARELTIKRMPPAVQGVYVQPDLSVIVPGPLAPRDEQVLMSLTVTEQVGVASTLRITPNTLARALNAGATVEQIRTELARLSVTGVPQPVEYLLDELQDRETLLVHEHHGDEGRTRLEVSSAAMRETLQVDRALKHLQLAPASAASPAAGQASPEHLFSRLSHEHVLAALLDARYPAVAAVARGTDSDDIPGAGTSVASAPKRAHALPAQLLALVERVSAAAQAEPDSGDVARRLDLAIRARHPVTLTASAQGQQRDFTLLPVSIAGGRLRATDVTAGVERTLPLSAIVSVVPAT